MDSVVVHMAPPVRGTDYSHLVRRVLGEEGCRDRGPELAALAEFAVSDSSAGSYAWWRADMWFGKSTLLAEFVLNPPAGVVVVSFFITSRWSDQNDRVAFLANVLPQLAEILDESLPDGLTSSTAQAHLLGMLEDAATTCAERGERLVLVVDGLDEDRGPTRGPGLHSIAGLLPNALPAGLKVIVSSRPHPALPRDVDDTHPLRNPQIVRNLTQSPWARAAHGIMQTELEQLLHGTELEQAVLGLLVAAVGGLTTVDLVELTGAKPYEIARLLGSVAGRTFDRRDGRWRTQPGDNVVILGHEDLLRTAVDMLGPNNIDIHVEQLHAWHERYRTQGWPEHTPEYLLRGYYLLLRSRGDTDRMVACVRDPDRVARLGMLSGGDAAALAEIGVLNELLLATDTPDLHTLARVAVRRSHLELRNSTVPAELPAVWIRIGHVARGESLARSLPDLERRVTALLGVAEAFVDIGHTESARVAMDEAGLIATRDPTGIDRREITGRLAVLKLRLDGRAAVESYAGSLSADMVVTVARSLTEKAPEIATGLLEGVPPSTDHELVRSSIVSALADTGDLTAAMAIAHELTGACHASAVGAVAARLTRDGKVGTALEMVSRIDDPMYHVDALSPVVHAAHSRYPSRWDSLVAELRGAVERAVGSGHHLHDVATAQLVSVLALDGHLEEAAARAADLRLGFARTHANRRLVTAAIADGDLDRAEDFAHAVVDAQERAVAFGELATALVRHGRRFDARRVTREVAPLASAQSWRRRPVITSFLSCVAEHGDLDLIDDLAAACPTAKQRAQILTDGSAVAALRGHLDHAARFAESAETQARAPDALAERQGGLGRLVLATVVSASDVDEAAQLARSLPDPIDRDGVLAALAHRLAQGSDPARAMRLIDLIHDRSWRARALAQHLATATALTATRTRELGRRAAEAARSGTPGEVVPLLPRAAVSVHAREADAPLVDELLDEAETRTRTIVEQTNRLGAIDAVIRARIAVGDVERCEGLLEDASRDARRALVQHWVREGDLDRAIAIASRHPGGPNEGSLVWMPIAVAHAERGDVDAVRALLQAEPRLGTSAESGQLVVALAECEAHELALCVARAASGSFGLLELLRHYSAADPKRAAAIDDELRIALLDLDLDTDVRASSAASTTALLVKRLARSGYDDYARCLADSLSGSVTRSVATATLADVADVCGDVENAALLTARALETAATITDPDGQIAVWRQLSIHSATRRTGHPTARLLALTGWATTTSTISPDTARILLAELSAVGALQSNA